MAHAIYHLLDSIARASSGPGYRPPTDSSPSSLTTKSDPAHGPLGRRADETELLEIAFRVLELASSPISQQGQRASPQWVK
jgi:hypothetical protein